MTDRYRVLDVSDWQAARDEPRGVTTKDWLLPPDSDEDEPEWLWKVVPVESTGHMRELGHDWGERVGAEVARLLTVPAATVELGRRNKQRGVICRSFASSRAGHPALSNASEILPTVVEGYDPDKKRENLGYSLDAVFAVLDGVASPAGSNEHVHDGQGAFAGVLVLDALIANQDRHHDNWGVLQSSDGTTLLAPAFDQACCLGYQAAEEDKVRRLNEGTVAEWAARGRSNQFRGRPSLVDLALDCLARIGKSAATYWLDRLEALSSDGLASTIEPVPDDVMSQADRSFALQVMCHNRERLLHGWASRRG